jgi:hypothetical protein
MLYFQRKPFSQEARRRPPVRFDTVALSGLYPFATTPAHCDGLLRRVLARQVEPT